MHRETDNDCLTKMFYIIRLYVVLTLAIIVGCDSVAFGQGAGVGATINLAPLRSTMPLVLGTVRVDGSRIVPGVQFHAHSDWLQHIHVVAFNRTIKPIIAITIELSFHAAGDGSFQKAPLLGFEAQLGNLPDNELVDPNGNKLKRTPHVPIELRAGDSINVDLGKFYPEYSDTLSTALQGSTPRICNIRVLAVTFSDGTLWSLTTFLRPDPTHPGRYQPIPSDQFFSHQ